MSISTRPPIKKKLTDSLRASYLNHLFETARQLSLVGIDPKAASDADTRLNLDAVYTALLTKGGEADERMMGDARAMQERGPRQLSALEQLNKHNRLVLLGDPGSGKSTFVKFVAMCLCGQLIADKQINLELLTRPLPQDDERPRQKKDEKPQPQAWDHPRLLLPVLIILRDFAATSLPAVGKKATAQHLWAHIVAELKTATLETYADELQNELREKGGLVLLDGLDEVPEADQRRVQIKEAVEDFAKAYPKCRVLITSRTYAYQNQDWRLPSFTSTELALFTPGTDSQLRRWLVSICGDQAR